MPPLWCHGDQSRLRDLIAVGAQLSDEEGTDLGAAFVFVKPGSNWSTATEDAALTASDGAANDYFGYSVGVSGDTVVVGAYADDDNGSGSGSVYVYEKPGTGWADGYESVKQSASDGEASDALGGSVAIDFDVVFAGATGDDDAATNAGAIYEFERDAGGTGNWGEAQKAVAQVISNNLDGNFMLNDHRSRLAVPVIGRFLNRDRLEYVDGFNLYEFLGSNPLRWTDPSGMARPCFDPVKCRAAAQQALRNCLKNWKAGGPTAPTKDDCFETFDRNQARCRAGRPGRPGRTISNQSFVECFADCLRRNKAGQKALAAGLGGGAAVGIGQIPTRGRWPLPFDPIIAGGARVGNRVVGGVAEGVNGVFGRGGFTIARGAKTVFRSGAKGSVASAILVAGGTALYYELKCAAECTAYEDDGY